MIDANATGGADTIDFDLGSSPTTITLGSQLPVVTAAGGALTIDGGSADITVSGQTQVRVFEVGNGANLTLNNLTVANGGNTAEGGGIYNHTGLVKMWNTTISGNWLLQSAVGGGVTNDNGQATMWNTIMDTFNSISANCSGTITNGGYNLDSGTTCGFGTANNSLSSTSALLGPPADNGGPTMTHALQAGSPAIDRGNNAFAVDPDGNPLPYDQRGQGFARIVGPAVDIGAFEVQQTLTQPPPGQPLPGGMPEDKQSCKKGGYEEFGFRSQGRCIKAVNHLDHLARRGGRQNPSLGFDWNNIP